MSVEGQIDESEQGTAAVVIAYSLHRPRQPGNRIFFRVSTFRGGGKCMNKRLFLLATFCFFGPFACFQAYGMDTATVPVNTAVVQSADIASAVKTAYANDASLAPFAGNVAVVVQDGVVTLTGSVPSEKVKLDFDSKAKSVMGVTKVVNNLEVKQVMK